jgi:lipid A 3-O-deacylase
MRPLLVLALVCCFTGTAHALDGASFEAGRGDERTDLWRLGLQWRWDKRWLEAGGWHLGAYWDVQLGAWNNGRDITDLSLTPVFRYQRSSGRAIPYAEAAIGFHMLSNHQITSGRIFSTRFQFGDHLGAGVRFGPHDVGLRIQHLSNGGIARPNPGINFLVLRYQLWLD